MNLAGLIFKILAITRSTQSVGLIFLVLMRAILDISFETKINLPKGFVDKVRMGNRTTQ